jgi:hypothetical protein
MSGTSKEQAKAILDADAMQQYRQFRKWQWDEVLRIATAKTEDPEDEERWNEDEIADTVLAAKRSQEAQIAQEVKDFIIAAAARMGMPAYSIAELVAFGLACERTGEVLETNAPIARELLRLIVPSVE